MAERPALRVLGRHPDLLEWDTIRVAAPGTYRFCLPNPRQALELKAEHPSGYLARVDGKLVWIERFSPDAS